MSDELKPDDLRLPDELAALEALLAAKPLAAAGIDRDQLMYRAGWAACEAALMQPRPSAGGRVASLEMATGSRGYPRAEPGAAGERRRSATWSLGSAALAASLAVAATLGWVGSVKRLDQPGRAGGETPRLATDESAATALVSNERIQNSTTPSLLNDLDRLIDADSHGRRPTFAGPWLALHRLDQQQLDARHEYVAADAEATPAAPKTIRDLQQELLPTAPTPPRVVWPWERSTSGDSI